VLHARLDPKNRLVFAAIPQGDAPAILKFIDNEWKCTELILKSDKDVFLASTLEFSRDSQYLLIGTTKGRLFVFDTNTCQVCVANNSKFLWKNSTAAP
jgi:hypothetical protein